MTGHRSESSHLINNPYIMPADSLWNVYILRCADDTFYTGICLNLTRRINEHNQSNELGARYTRARRPVTLVYHECLPSRSAAAKREHQIKQLSREQKATLINRCE